MVYRQRPALPVAGLLHRSTVDPTVDRDGHSRGIVQVNLLRQIMTDRARNVPAEPATGHKVATQSHPLLDHPAPPFVLNDAWGKTWNLREEVRRRAGRRCLLPWLHLHGLRHSFDRARCGHAAIHARHARVLAISSDTPDFSLDRMHKYGELQIPLLSDADHAVSLAYGVWKAVHGRRQGQRRGGSTGRLLSIATGLVRWAYVGDRPFTDVEALLTELDGLTETIDRYTIGP